MRSRRLARLALLLTVIGGAAGAAYTFTQMPDFGDASKDVDEDAEPPEVTSPLIASPDETSGQDAGDDALDEAQAEAELEADRPPPGAQFVEQAFGNAGGFRDAVERAGLSRTESLALIAALDGVLDFTRCRPDDVLTLRRNAQGELSHFGYRASLTQRYEAVRRDDGSLEGRQIEVPIRRVRIRKGGVVSGSLGDALEGLSLKRNLAGVFVEVFDGHVAFTTDTRSGDTFRVMVDEEYVEDTFLGYGTVHALEFTGQKTGKLRAYWYEGKEQPGDFYDPRGRAMHGGWLRTPLRYDHISSPYGMRFHPVLKRKKLHAGIDYAAPSGTPINAAASGTVTFAARKGANGNLVAIKHANQYETLYAHMLRFAPGIKAGAKVKQRQLIGYVGSTGRSTGPHLHFGLKHRGRTIDPADQLNGPGQLLPRRELAAYKKRVRELGAQLDRIALETPSPVTNSDPEPATDAVDDTEL